MKGITVAAIPKPNSRMSQKRGITILDGGRPAPALPELPTPPADLSAPIAEAWAAFWRSPLRVAVIETDLPALRRLFEMYERRAQFDEAGMREPVVVGSQQQEVLSALLREVDVLDSKILALEDRFGMSPLSRLRLQVKVGDASRSIAATNARLAAGALDASDDQAEDLRKPAGRVPAAKV
jgi:hypothetical protein